MPNLLVVGRLPEKDDVSYANGYRGVQRDYIAYPVEFYDNSPEILDIHDKYNKITEKDGYIHDSDFAIILRDTYNKYYPNANKEIIEVVSPGQKPEWGNSFIGYDIVDRMDSNIMEFILRYDKDTCPAKEDIFRSLMWVISKSVIGSLNKDELFDSLEIAEITLSMLDKVFELYYRPTPHHLFSVQGIYVRI